MYSLIFSKTIKKDTQKIEKADLEKIDKKLELLKLDPRTNGAEALKGKHFKCCHRIRIGKYRVIYEIIDSKLIIYIISISKRCEAYKDQ